MRLAIIGPGRVGTALATAASRAGSGEIWVAGRDEAAARRVAAPLGERAHAVSVSEAATADLIWVTVPDDHIAEVGAAVAAGVRQSAVVAHCSGALSSEVLASVRQASGCAIAAAHPIQTFPSVATAVRDLPGSVWAIEGDDRALAVVEPFLASLGSRSMRIDPQAKIHLHMAAVLACNDLVALVDAALEVAEPAVGNRARGLDALLPILEATVRNVAALGPERALTGPIVRGDLGTLRRHQHALQTSSAQVRSIYAALGRRALDLALRRGAVTATTASDIAGILDAIAASDEGGTRRPGVR